MYEIKCDVAVIGGGPAGLAASVAAKKAGAEKVLIIERDEKLGGILQQCIHPGFGLKLFKEELTGPEYFGRFVKEAEQAGVDTLLNSMVLEIGNKEVYCINSKYGVTKISAGAIVLAMGCRERTRANICIPGTRPAGIYTAGAAQRLMNRQNEMVGKKVVILGSGDIGMIMARRMTLEGAKVEAVVELQDYLAGLTRNRVQCLDDFGIPLMLSHTIVDIKGNDRVEGVVVAEVDDKKQPIPGTEQLFECDTLLLSVGLIPENEITRKASIEINRITNGPAVNQFMQTSTESVFACGNVVHVNDLVDNVSTESAIAGASAAKYAAGTLGGGDEITVVTGENVRYVCPQKVSPNVDEKVNFYFRVLAPKKGVVITAKDGDNVLFTRKAIKVNPGEIEKVSVNPKGIKSLTIEVTEA